MAGSYKCTPTTVKKFLKYSQAYCGSSLKDTTTGDTLCDEKNEVILESMNSRLVIEVLIEPSQKLTKIRWVCSLTKIG